MGKRYLIDVPWITSDGFMDMSKIPLDAILSKAVSGDRGKMRDGLRLLASVYAAGRSEAGIFLLGFLVNLPPDDLEMRQATVEEALCHVKTAGCAAVLFWEL